MNYRELLYKFSSLPVKAFAIQAGPVKMNAQKLFPGFTASVLLNTFQISAERMRVMACRRGMTGSMLVLEPGIGIFSFWNVQKLGAWHLQKNFFSENTPTIVLCVKKARQVVEEA